MNRTTLGVDGITAVPLRRVATDVLLEGWLHYEGASYRYYRWNKGFPQIELRHKDVTCVSRNVVPLKAVPTPGLPDHEFDRVPVAKAPPAWSNMQDDVFKKAAYVVQVEEMKWTFKVYMPMSIHDPIEGESFDRLGAIEAADKIMSKFLVQDVHDDPVDLRDIAEEIRQLRSMLSHFVFDLRERPPEADETVTVHARGDIVNIALRLLNLQTLEEGKARCDRANARAEANAG